MFTKKYPLSANLIHLFNSTDCHVISNLIAKSAIEQLGSLPIKTVQEKTMARLEALILAFKKLVCIGLTPLTHALQGIASPQTILPLPEPLQALPLYILALLKSAALRTYQNVHPDKRNSARFLISILPPEDLALYLYPRLIKLSELPDEVSR